jgi:hypothetical protein
MRRVGPAGSALSSEEMTDGGGVAPYGFGQFADAVFLAAPGIQHDGPEQAGVLFS